MRLRFSILTMIFSFSSMFGGTPEQDFWRWFTKNDERLFTFEKDQEHVFDELAVEMRKVHESLTFEFGPVRDGRREFVVSADGIKAAFPKVESLVAAHPDLKRWIIVQFRPRREPMDIKYKNLNVRAAAVRVLIGRSTAPDKLELLVLFPDFDASRARDFKGVAFLLLDSALGEFDVETKVGYIGVGSTEHREIHDAYSLTEFPAAFDHALEAKQKRR